MLLPLDRKLTFSLNTRMHLGPGRKKRTSPLIRGQRLRVWVQRPTDRRRGWGKKE